MTAADPQQPEHAKHDDGTDEQGAAPLPHERDEAAQPEAERGQREGNREVVRQAHADVERGLVDTERIGTPNDVPASTGRR